MLRVRQDTFIMDKILLVIIALTRKCCQRFVWLRGMLSGERCGFGLTNGLSGLVVSFPQFHRSLSTLNYVKKTKTRTPVELKSLTKHTELTSWNGNGHTARRTHNHWGICTDYQIWRPRIGWRSVRQPAEWTNDIVDKGRGKWIEVVQAHSSSHSWRRLCPAVDANQLWSDGGTIMMLYKIIIT